MTKGEEKQTFGEVVANLPDGEWLTNGDSYWTTEEFKEKWPHYPGSDRIISTCGRRDEDGNLWQGDTQESMTIWLSRVDADDVPEDKRV